MVLIGADHGVVDAGKKTASPGAIAFARSLPLATARSDGTILAFAMNDAALTLEHGYPLRAVVGGWFGMAWVKWLTAIRVVERPFLGYWQGARLLSVGSGTRASRAWSRFPEMEVKAQIAQPVNGATVSVGERVRIFGAAWSGDAPIRTVRGRHRRRRRLAAGATARTGDALRLAPVRALLDAAGAGALSAALPRRRCRRQRRSRTPSSADRESYVANWIVPVEVEAVVRGREGRRGVRDLTGGDGSQFPRRV